MDAKPIPDDFYKVIDDFLRDVTGTFPELLDGLNEDLLALVSKTEDTPREDMEPHYAGVYDHIMSVLPVRFFDILYENADMFDEDDANCEFLPGIDFKLLWKDNITAKTKTVIWKYLQLILIMVVGQVDSGDSFGDTARLFEAIDDDALKDKLGEALSGITALFDIGQNGGAEDEATEEGTAAEGATEEAGAESAGAEAGAEASAEAGTGAEAGAGAAEATEDGPSMPDGLPNAEELHEHLNGLLGGKLGSLAKEIADETAADLKVDLADVKSTGDVFQKLLKDPKKLFGLVHSVGGKIDQKIKSGDIKESELIEEATEMLKKMKEMPGMSGMEQMFKNMAGGGKMDLKAMQNKLSGNLKNAKQKERMLAKLQEKRAAAELAAKMMADGAAAIAEQGQNTVMPPGSGPPGPASAPYKKKGGNKKGGNKKKKKGKSKNK